MRIIGGTCKGRKLRIPHVQGLRPTYNKVREALFNIICQNCKGVSFLDLFSGTGSVGIEALSREAELVVFIEKNHETVNNLNYNISLLPLELQKRARVIHADIKKGLTRVFKESLKFDIIFSDPPYLFPELNYEVLDIIKQFELLKNNGIVVIEQSSRILPHVHDGFFILDKRGYGDSTLVFYGITMCTNFLGFQERMRK